MFVICFYKLLSKTTGKLQILKSQFAIRIMKTRLEGKVRGVLMRLRVVNANRGKGVLSDQLRKINLKVQEFLYHDVSFRGKVALMQDQISKKLEEL